MKITITRAIVLVTLISSLAALTVVSGYSLYSSRKALAANADIILEAHARNVQHQTGMLLAPVPPLAAAMTELVAREGSPLDHEEKSYRFLVEKLKDLPTVYSVYWGDADGRFFLVGRRPMKDNPGRATFFLRTIRIDGVGRQVAESWFSADGEVRLKTEILTDDPYDPRSRPWYRTAVTAGRPAWTDPYIFYITGKPGLTYAVPLGGKQGVSSVSAVDLETDSLSRYLQQILPTPGSRIFVLTPQGKVVGFSAPPGMAGQPARSTSEPLSLETVGDDQAREIWRLVARGIRGEQHRIAEIGGKRFHVNFVDAVVQGLPVVGVIAIPEEELFAPLTRSRWKILVVSCVIMVVLAAGGLLFSRAVSSPMAQLRAAAAEIGRGNFHTPLSVDTCLEEIDLTFAAFRNMQDGITAHVERIERLNLDLRSASQECVYRLAMAAEYRDRETAGHLHRVSSYSRRIGVLAGLPPEETELLYHASLMHDVGKIGIPDMILTKPGRFTREERLVMEEHTVIGGKILSEPSSELMVTARAIALSHHEWWDGSGYPAGLAGEEIPLWGRIVALADVMDSLLSSRPYKVGYSFDQVMAEIRSRSGSHFDPELASLVLEHAEEFREMSMRDTGGASRTAGESNRG